MRTGPELGVAVVGLGVGEEHARAFLSTKHCRLRAFYDLDPAKSRRLAELFGVDAIALTFEEILQNPDAQVVSIASYDDAHFEQVLMALRAAKHIFVEKPLCRSTQELRAIERAWRENGACHLASNLVLRVAPLYQWLKRAIEAGDLGEMYAFDGDYLYGRLHKIAEGWRKDVHDYSVMQGGGIHLVDLMLWLTRERPVWVMAAGNRIATAGTGFRYHDYMAATFRFASGLVGRITANFGCVHRHQHVVRVFGTKATFIYDDMGPRLHEGRDPSIPPKMLDMDPLPASKGALIPVFIDGIQSGRDTRAETRHEFDVISACVAADQALATGQAVEIEYV